MCGRFIVTASWREYYQYLTILPPAVEARNGPPANYNVAPTSVSEIVTVRDGEIGIEPVKWGLVPSWAKDAKKIKAQINARGETVAERPMFRTAFQYGRCIVPATGYYEWLVTDKAKKEKQPFLIHLPGDAPTFEPFGFAGIFARNRAMDTVTFAIITLAASDNIKHIHDRMPVVLRAEALAPWMDHETNTEAALELLQQNRGPDLKFYPVTPAVGNVRNKGPELIDSID